MNISYQCPHCGKIIPIDPADENRIIKQFLEEKEKEPKHQTKHTAFDYVPNDDTMTDELKTETFYLPETPQEAIKRWKKEREEGK